MARLHESSNVPAPEVACHTLRRLGQEGWHSTEYGQASGSTELAEVSSPHGSLPHGRAAAYLRGDLIDSGPGGNRGEQYCGRRY
jgi:hypothetical protein